MSSAYTVLNLLSEPWGVYVITHWYAIYLGWQHAPADRRTDYLIYAVHFTVSTLLFFITQLFYLNATHLHTHTHTYTHMCPRGLMCVFGPIGSCKITLTSLAAFNLKLYIFTINNRRQSRYNSDYMLIICQCVRVCVCVYLGQKLYSLSMCMFVVLVVDFSALIPYLRGNLYSLFFCLHFAAMPFNFQLQFPFATVRSTVSDFWPTDTHNTKSVARPHTSHTHYLIMWKRQRQTKRTAEEWVR